MQPLLLMERARGLQSWVGGGQGAQPGEAEQNSTAGTEPCKHVAIVAEIPFSQHLCPPSWAVRLIKAGSLRGF